MKKKYGSLSNIYKYISKMKLFNLKISLSNDFGTGPLTLFSFEKKKKIHLPGTLYSRSYIRGIVLYNEDNTQWRPRNREAHNAL